MKLRIRDILIGAVANEYGITEKEASKYKTWELKEMSEKWYAEHPDYNPYKD